VRGYNERVYFAETSGNNEKIIEVEINSNELDAVTKKEIF